MRTRHYFLLACTLSPGPWSSCTNPDPVVDDDERDYAAPPPATNDHLEDTASDRERNADANSVDPVNHSVPPAPVRPDSANGMPPR